MMNASNLAARYKKVEVTTSSQGDILLLLFEGLLRFINEAAEAMRKGDRARSGERITRSHAIIEQLLTTLKPEANPELCGRLSELYIFCMDHLLSANIKQKPEYLDDVHRLIYPVYDGFRTVIRGAP